ncbi:MAG: 3'-5' exonuclease [Bacteroidota bacterium]
MKLTLTRPIVFFDLETTGRDFTRDRIVQIAALKVFPDGNEEMKTRLINPGIPIPPEATDVHHITDADVAGEPRFRDLAKGIHEFFQGADIGGFNSNRFDLPFLVEEFGRCGLEFPPPDAKLIDVQTIYHKKEERTLAAAYRYYCNKALESAHNAEADVRATLEVFRRQVEMYDDIGSTVEEIHAFCEGGLIVDYGRKLMKNQKGEIVYAFGKNRGKPVLDDPGYAEWMLGGDFPESTKSVLRRLLKSRKG